MADAMGDAIGYVTGELPWLIPVSLVALVLTVLASGPVGRWLGVSRLVAGVLVLDLGLILAATLTPLGYECVMPGAAPTCDMSRVGPPAFGELWPPTDALGNILAFVPLGVAIGLAPPSGRKGALVAAALGLPFAIEAVQLSVVALQRTCQSADLVDNLTGLTIGLVAGVLAEWARRSRPGLPRPPSPPDPAPGVR